MKKNSFRLYVAATFLSVTMLFHAGCAMCCGTFDYAYAGHGGKYQRSDLFNGRVGSPFSDPNIGYAQGTEGEIIEELDEMQLEEIQ